MRQKDQSKISKIFQATLTLVNQIGFASSSVSKIAKEADVSPATIYIYYKNKEDLLINTYLQIKKNINEAIFNNLNQYSDVKETLKNAWFNAFNFLSKHSDYTQFIQQFENSPYKSLISEEFLKEHFLPIETIFKKGIEQKLIKDLTIEVLALFAFSPLLTFTANIQNAGKIANDDLISLTFEMAWDAIRQ